MLKKSLMRGAASYCACVTITLILAMVLLLCGAPALSTPAFIERAGGELKAACLQTLLIGLIGFAFGAGSMLFEIERWSFLMQGAAHLALTTAVWIPVELFCFSPITPPVVLSFTLSTAATYAITWSARYFTCRAQVHRLNEQIHQKNGGTFN